MSRKQIPILMLVLVAIAGILLNNPVEGIHAYLTDTTDIMENNFTIALDPTTTVVEKYLADVPDIEDKAASYEKMVQVGNTGYLDAYVRVKLVFSEKDIEDKTAFSSDGTTYYSVSSYRSHLPSGWTYNASDGFYYYTPILYAGDWEKTSSGLEYRDSVGEYFYKTSGQATKSSTNITTPLVRYVKTTFDTMADMRSYDLIVVSESCPSYYGTNYSNAWSNYLADKGL